jgi:hypothetical protein
VLASNLYRLESPTGTPVRHLYRVGWIWPRRASLRGHLYQVVTPTSTNTIICTGGKNIRYKWKIGPETNASSDNYFSTLARLCTPAARVRILFGRDISHKKFSRRYFGFGDFLGRVSVTWTLLHLDIVELQTSILCWSNIVGFLWTQNNRIIQFVLDWEKESYSLSRSPPRISSVPDLRASV